MSVEWDVNYIAVVIAAVAGMIIGAVYFQPAVAGKAWMKAVGKTEEDLRDARRPVLYLAAAICQLLIATVLAATMNWAGADGVGDGVLVGALVWIGFAAPIVGITLMFELRSFSHHAITAGHTLVALVVMGGIIGAIS